MTPTERILSIRKIRLIRQSIPYTGGDWDDLISEFSSALQDHELDDFPGITPDEWGTLICGDWSPRACSKMISDLSDEIKSFTFDESDKAQLLATIKDVEILVKALRSMYISTDKIVDSFFTSGAYAMLEDTKCCKTDWHDYQADISLEGDGSLTKDSRRLMIKLELDIRQ